MIVPPPEEKSHGSIKFATYSKYFLAGGNLLVLFVLLLLLIFGEVRTVTLFMLYFRVQTHTCLIIIILVSG